MRQKQHYIRVRRELRGVPPLDPKDCPENRSVSPEVRAILDCHPKAVDALPELRRYIAGILDPQRQMAIQSEIERAFGLRRISLMELLEEA